MLATVIAMLVEEGKLNWDTKAADVLEIPRANGLRTNEITLKQLLNHHAGLPPFEDDSASEWKAWTKERPSSGSSADRVQQFAQWLLQRPTIGAPAVKFVFSNAGYVVAAAMVERVTGMTWKDAARKRLFEPLGMQTARCNRPLACRRKPVIGRSRGLLFRKFQQPLWTEPNDLPRPFGARLRVGKQRIGRLWLDTIWSKVLAA